ncbi:MAG: PPi-type phosphoenolpyruvate carboxykinase [Opitutia bacterium UBA7350]|nr:MAG: PPi-type phosphoenolpyruvate carboxykinase [Opitutae bacterium UBA7350]
MNHAKQTEDCFKFISNPPMKEKDAMKTDFKTQLGLDPKTAESTFDQATLLDYVNLKLSSIGQPTYGALSESKFYDLNHSLLASYQEKARLLADYLPPCDQRIQNFLLEYFSDLDSEEIPQLPGQTLILDRHGVARTLSLPAGSDHFSSDIIDSYRIQQGVLHNPKSDRRTTKGVFHVGEGGLPIPNDKKAVPKLAAARLITKALNPPAALRQLPFLAQEAQSAASWVSLLLRPVVIPEVEGFISEKRLEVRFFAPGNLVSNLDFVESIFGNGGDPFLAKNDAGLDPEHWTGHSGCVILAPHLVGTTKKELGLPKRSEATERQIRDGMCWEKEDELYNDGGAFKITCRDTTGQVVTAIADNYFGYCKKEVKTQIGFSANLHGLAEEEHAGGTLAFTGYDLGEDFNLSRFFPQVDQTFDGLVARIIDAIELQPEGYAIDKNYPDIIYIPEDAHIELNNQTISWEKDGQAQEIKLLPRHSYVLPSGYKVEMLKPAAGRRWRLVGYTAESRVCHKPSTVSGGGKSEISKSISDAIISGPVFVSDFEKDFTLAQTIIERNYSDRFRDLYEEKPPSRPLLSSERSLGSVIKLLTPSETTYSDDYNQWLESIPQHVKELVLIIKRFYKKDWGKDWHHRFSVDLINGAPGNILRYRGTPMVTQYLRVGYTNNGSWRTFGLRKDFMPAAKISLEDDITASVVVPSEAIKHLPVGWTAPSAKFVHNCEFRFFQRPDDAIIRGYDTQAEIDLSSSGSFLSNYEPLEREHAHKEIEDAIRFEQYTPPMQELIRSFHQANSGDYYATNAFPRIVDGKPTKNPRYLQVRPDLRDIRATYLADMSTRLFRRQDLDSQLIRPVTSILPGRRNNPAEPEAGVKPLCTFNPIHYMELPELFMEFIASITGKSPSTTGAGSEGALTKAPFNALPPIYDLNNALVAFLATEQPAFITAAAYVGPHYRVDHDISLLVPEIWCRLRPEEADPQWLIEHDYLDKIEDFEHAGKIVKASRLGYRINSKFVRIFFARVFNNPDSVLTEEMLKPELQDMDNFVEGMETILAAHREVAQNYFADGSVELACPPLRALLHIMAHGEYEGKSIEDPELRAMFSREVMLKSDWYQERLQSQQEHDVQAWKKHVQYLEQFLEKESHRTIAAELHLEERLRAAKDRLEHVHLPEYQKELCGSIGRQPID